MFSKFNLPRVIALWVVAALTLSGCNTRIGEDPPAVDPYKYQGAACLSESGATIKKFIEGNAANYEVGALWDCVNSAVSEFKKNVQGSTKNQFTSQELATFLENNFIDQSKGPQRMSKELQLELMKVKTLLVGGTVQYVTRSELELAAKTFTTLRDVSITINPYMKVFAMNWTVSGANNMQKDMQFFEDANSAIQKGGETLASMIEKNGRSYVLSDCYNLLTELSKFLKEKWEFTETVKKYMPVVQKIKKAISGGNENEVAPSEWPRFVMLGARGYVQYLRYYYFIQAAPETGSAYRLAYLSRTVEDILSVFQDLVAKKPEGVVSREEVTDLLMTLSKAWPDFKMSAPLITEVMKVKRLFFGGSTDSFTTVDFNTARLKISRLKALIERFMPYYAIYGGERDPSLYSTDEAQKIFMESQFILEASGRELGVLVESSYDLRDIVSLIAEFEKLYPPTRKSDSLTEAVKKYIPAAIDAKKNKADG